MLKYTNYDVVFREIPDETTLAINISNCPRRCKGCHSAELRGDIGTELTGEVLWDILDKQKGITCVAFMGGESDLETLFQLMLTVGIRSDTPYKIAWYTGMTEDEALDVLNKPFDAEVGIYRTALVDYVKTGEYVEELGPLSSKTTNQRLYKLDKDTWEDITYKFWEDK